MNIENRFEGYDVTDYVESVELRTMTKEDVFEVFNASVTAIEAESEARVELIKIHDGALPFDYKTTAEFVLRYDDFINASDFELEAFEVSKLEMENFWAFIERNNEFKIVTRQETYGKTAIYEFGTNRGSVGYLMNNMTFDGQNMYCLTSVRYKAAAHRPFKATGRYPALVNPIARRNEETGQMEKPLTRWGKIVAKLEAVGGTTVNAWSILESEDARFFYGELKKHNVFTRQDKALLKAIRRQKGGMTFESYKDYVQERIDEIKAKIEDLEGEIFIEDGFLNFMAENLSVEEFEVNQDVLQSKTDIQAANLEIIDLQEELAELEDTMLSFDEEDNSMPANSEIEDYDNWNYYLENGY